MDINQTPLDPSQFGSNVPRRDDPNIAKLAAKYLKMRGWQLVGEMPNVKQLVMLAVPHTSNEDGWNAVMGILTLGIDVKLMGKKELFRIPVIGPFLKWGGMISIDRHKKGSTLQATLEQFNQQDQLWLGLAPRGVSPNGHRSTQAGKPLCLPSSRMSCVMRQLGNYHAN